MIFWCRALANGKEIWIEHLYLPSVRTLFFFLKSSICTRIRETIYYKLLSQWYRTPFSLSRFFPEASDCEGQVYLISYLLALPEVQKISQKFTIFFFSFCFSLYFLILKDPAFLLHCSQMPPQTYRKSVLCHLVNAAKACITLCLKDPNPPSIAMWLNKVRSINAMEDLVLTAQDRREQCTKTWSHWDKFVYSDEGKLLLESCLVDWGFPLSPFNTNTQSIALGGEGGLYFVLGLDFFFALKRKEEGTEVSVWVNLGALFFHLLGMERRKGLSDI